MTVAELSRAAGVKKAEIQNMIRSRELTPTFDDEGHYFFNERAVKKARAAKSEPLKKEMWKVHFLGWIEDLIDSVEVGRDLHKNRPTYKKHKWSFTDKFHFWNTEKKDASKRR